MSPAKFLIALQVIIGLPAVLLSQTEKVELPRVGSTIDKSERAYFQLFPRLDGFVSAEMQRISKNRYALKVTFALGANDTIIELFEQEFEQLKEYVENAEQYYKGKSANWKSIGEVVDLSIARKFSKENYQHGSVVTILYNDGKSTSGLLLYLDKERIYLLPDKQSYSVGTDAKSILSAGWGQIQQIQIKEPGSPVLGAALGLLLGGFIGANVGGSLNDRDGGIEDIGPALENIAAGAIVGGLVLGVTGGVLLRSDHTTTVTDFHSDKVFQTLRSHAVFREIPPPEIQ